MNVVTASADFGGETWVGTGMGVKRIRPANGRVRHYTRFDGLPGDVVHAIAPDSDGVWCIVSPPQPGKRSVLVCRWDRRTDRWATLREWEHPPRLASHEPSFPYVILPGRDTVTFLLGRVSGTGGQALALWDRRRKRWQDVAWPADVLEKDEPHWSPVAAFVHADAVGIWLGTSAGLLRYRLKERRWERFLTDFGISAGAAQAGGFWLSGVRRTGNTPGYGLHLVRFLPRTGEARDQAAADGPALRGYYGGATKIVLGEDGGIWLLIGGGWDDGARAIHRFDPKTGAWRLNVAWEREEHGFGGTFSVEELGRLPAAVFRTAVTTFGGIPPGLVARRLPGWLCEPARFPTDIAPERTTRGPRYVDTDGAVWTAEEAGSLRRVAGRRTERIPLPGIPIAETPPVSDLALVGDDLFARSGATIHRFHIPSRKWAGIDLPKTVPTVSHSDDVLYAENRNLWIQHGNRVFYYEAGTQTLTDVTVRAERGGFSGSSGQPIGVLRGGGVYGPSLPTPQEVQARLHTGHQPNPVAAAGGFYWYHNEAWDAADKAGRTIVVPYSGGWRSELRFRFRAARISLFASGDYVYVLPSMWNGSAPEGNEGSVYRYNTRTDRWDTFAPPPPADAADPSSAYYGLVSVDDARVWAVDRRKPFLWEYDRRSGTWRSHPCPDLRRFGYGSTTAVRHGDTIFVGAAEGLWRVDARTGAWERMYLTGEARNLRPVQIAGDAGAIWALCWAESSRQAFALRWDRAARSWKVWGEASGFPERFEPNRLTPDGSSAWVIAGGRYGSKGAYRLNPKSDRWERLTDALAPAPGVEVRAHDIAAGGGGTWLLLSASWKSGEIRTDRPSGVPGLVRYDPARGDWDRFDRPVAHLLLNRGDGVWVSGVRTLHRLDTASRAWQTVEAPAGFPTPTLPVWDRFLHSDGALWLVDRDTVLRWQAPAGKLPSKKRSPDKKRQ